MGEFSTSSYKLATRHKGIRKFVVTSYKVVRQVSAVMLNVSMGFLAVLTIAVALDVLMRYLLNSPLTGVKQFAEYALVWLCFLSAGWVLIQRKHVAISYLEYSFFRSSKARERHFSVFIDLTCLLYTGPLLLLSARSVWIEFIERTVISGEAGGFPTFLAELCIPVGFLCLTLILLSRIVSTLLGMEEREGVLVDSATTENSQ
jgi:C4-dicarboxylate transporter DctQ subunit